MDLKITFPKKLILIGISSTIFFMGIAIWALRVQSSDIQASFKEEVRLRNLINKIVYLDEVLTMSAKMAVATGDLKWKRRYEVFEPKLDEAIKSAIEFAPSAYSGSSAQKTDKANVKLVEMEQRAFTLLLDGKRKAAKDLLDDKKYDEQKKVYSKGMDEFLGKLDSILVERRKNIEKKTTLSLAAFLLLFIVIFLSWIKIHQVLANWKTQLLFLNDSLDQKVKRRTMQLEREKEKVVQSSKLAAVGEMAGQIAHEMNTPLGAIQLTTSSLKKKVIKGKITPKTLDSQLDLIMDVSKKLAKIIESVRKLSSGSGDEKTERVLVRSLIEDTLLLCEGRFVQHDVKFSVNYEIDENVETSCRPTEIGQVIVNLLNNAIDANKGIDSERWIKINIRKSEKNSIVFEVSNNGLGIPDEIREKIFETRFSTKSLVEGTGFGLALSRKIVQEHGGDLLLLSGSPEETVFSFELLEAS